MLREKHIAVVSIIASSFISLSEYFLPYLFLSYPLLQTYVQPLLLSLAVAKSSPSVLDTEPHAIIGIGEVCSGLIAFELIFLQAPLLVFPTAGLYLVASSTKTGLACSLRSMVVLVRFCLLASFVVLVGKALSPVLEILLLATGLYILFIDLKLKRAGSSPIDSQMLRSTGLISNSQHLSIIAATLLVTIYVSLSFGKPFFSMFTAVFLPNILGMFVGSPVAAASAVGNVLFLFVITFYFSHLLVGLSEKWRLEGSIYGKVPELYGTATVPVIGYFFTRIPHTPVQKIPNGYGFIEGFLVIFLIIALFFRSLSIFPHFRPHLSDSTLFSLVLSEENISGGRHLTISLSMMFIYVAYLLNGEILELLYFAWLLWMPVVWRSEGERWLRVFWVVVLGVTGFLFVVPAEGAIATRLRLSGVFLRNIGILCLVDEFLFGANNHSSN